MALLYDNVQELNEFLASGWKVVSQAAAANGNHIILSYIVELNQDLAESTENTNSAMGQLVLSMGGAVASGAILGSTFGPLGTTIGAVAGGVAEEFYHGFGDLDAEGIVKEYLTEELKGILFRE